MKTHNAKNLKSLLTVIRFKLLNVLLLKLFQIASFSFYFLSKNFNVYNKIDGIDGIDGTA